MQIVPLHVLAAQIGRKVLIGAFLLVWAVRIFARAHCEPNSKRGTHASVCAMRIKIMNEMRKRDIIK